MREVEVRFANVEARPAFVLDDVKAVDLRGIKAQRGENASIVVLKKVEDFTLQQCKGVPDTRVDRVTDKRF